MHSVDGLHHAGHCSCIHHCYQLIRRVRVHLTIAILFGLVVVVDGVERTEADRRLQRLPRIEG
jgi:hypothetical protein